jgi:hypothetical protein
MAAIQDIFNQPGAAFVLLPNGIKFPPIEKSWQTKPHTYQEAEVHKGNVGVMAGGCFLGLDQDEPTAFEKLSIPKTCTWETRPGRLGKLFLVEPHQVPDILKMIGKKPDLAQLKLYKDGKPVGEVKLQRTYQVIPPSWKMLEDGTRADYKMLEAIPPIEISFAGLIAELRAASITFSSKLDQNAETLEDRATKARQRRAESDEKKARRYAEAALRDEVNTLAGTPDGTRNDQLNKSAFALGQFVTAGVLSETEVINALSKAASYAGLDHDEIERTIRSGLEAGAKHPRKIPAQDRQKAEDPTSELLKARELLSL